MWCTVGAPEVSGRSDAPLLHIPESYYEQGILHSDINYFYAQCETLRYPQLRGKPVAVVGSEIDRSGIVLTATPQAKLRGVKTAMVYWEAQKLCPDIIFVEADYDLYQRFSRMVRNIYCRYTDQVEPFGLDEAWLDVGGSCALFGTPYQIAQDISETIKREVGLTVSIGVSYNKSLAKLGSDLKKPDAITVLDRHSWKDRVFPLPVGELIMIGARTVPKLARLGIYTIGDLANTPCWVLEEHFGKMGLYYYMLANGLDQSPVALDGTEVPEKSIGHSRTAPCDLVSEEEVRQHLVPSAEAVAAKVRKAGVRSLGVAVYLRDNELHGLERQRKFVQPTNLARVLLEAGMELYRKNRPSKPIRAAGIKAIYLVPADMPYQIDLSVDAKKQAELERLENAKDDIRLAFGNESIKVGRAFVNKKLSSYDPEREHTVHPVGYLHQTG